MGWDRKVFNQSQNIFGNRNVAKDKIEHCSGCNQPIGAVSSTLYELESHLYCSDCYSKTIVNQAVERDHADIKLEKKH